MRVSCDYYWAIFICSFLDEEGYLTLEKERQLHTKLDKILIDRTVLIGDEILDPVFKFMRYCLLGSFALNEFSTGDAPNKINVESGVLKRKWIIEQMANG